LQREPDYAARPEAKLEAVLGWLLSDGDLFAPGNPVESPGEIGLRLEGANSFHAASRPRRRAFSLRRRVLGRRGSGHRRAGTSGQRMPRRRRVRWLPDNRLGGRIAGQGVQVALHSSGRGLFTHEKNPLPRWHPRGFYRVPCPPATLSEKAREQRAHHRPRRNRPHCHRDDRLVSSRRLPSSSGDPSRTRSSLPATRHMAQDEVTTSFSPKATR
jgi:hypothetical protein